MKFKFTDNGEVVEVDTYKSLVDYMRESTPFIKANDNQEYMIGYAVRSVISQNIDIRAYNESVFIEDLLKFNHLDLLENNLN